MTLDILTLAKRLSEEAALHWSELSKRTAELRAILEDYEKCFDRNDQHVETSDWDALGNREFPYAVVTEVLEISSPLYPVASAIIKDRAGKLIDAYKAFCELNYSQSQFLQKQLASSEGGIKKCQINIDSHASRLSDSLQNVNSRYKVKLNELESKLVQKGPAKEAGDVFQCAA